MGTEIMIKISTRQSKFAELRPYDHFAKKDDYIEVCEWSNLEGFDVTLSANGREQHFSLTWGEWQALQALVAYQGDKADGEK